MSAPQENQLALQGNRKFEQMSNSLMIKKGEQSLLRSMTSIMNANLPYKTRAPIVLERSYRISELIVWQAHKLMKHQYTKQTLAEVRSIYWLPNGKSFVKSMLRKCTQCQKYNGRPYSYPDTPNMPQLRLRDDAPFSGVGVDVCCNNIYHKSEGEMLRGTLYVCVHQRRSFRHNAEAKGFTNSFSRFIIRRGCPVTVLSGNVFIAEETQSFVSAKNVEWKI